MYATAILASLASCTATHKIDVLYHCHCAVVNDFWCSTCFGQIETRGRRSAQALPEAPFALGRNDTGSPRTRGRRRRRLDGDDDGGGWTGTTIEEAGWGRRRLTTDVVGDGEASPGTVPTIRMSARPPGELLRESAADSPHFNAAPCILMDSHLLRYLDFSIVHDTVRFCPAEAAR
jgi:hypothetical protein